MVLRTMTQRYQDTLERLWDSLQVHVREYGVELHWLIDPRSRRSTGW
jgi:hypothetical protein